MIPIRTDSRLRSTPWMNWGIIAVTVAAFVVQQQFGWVTSRLALQPRDPSVLHFFTYGLLHGSPMHLLSNMLFLYIFGNNVNDKMGHLGYLAFYWAGCVFAGIGYVATERLFPMIGASGAVAAVTGAYLCLFPRARVTVLFWFILIAVFEVPSVWFIGFFFFKDLIFNFSGAPTGVAHVAHLSGSLFGFAVSIGLLAINLLPRDHFDVVALFKQWNRRRQFRDLTAKGYDPFAYAPRSKVDVRLPPPADPRQDQIHDLRAQITTAVDQHDYPRAADLYVKLRQIDPDQVLARQAQLDVAAQLASQQRHADAAAAYELFLRHYKNFEQVEQVELMLGLIYARYLEQFDKAKEYLLRAMARLHGDRELKLARDELRRVEIAQALPPNS